MLDEPTAGLDELGIKAVRAFVAASKERGATTIVMTHAPIFVDMSDHTYVLKNGMAMELPRPEQQQAQPGAVNLARLRNLGPQGPSAATAGAAG